VVLLNDADARHSMAWYRMDLENQHTSSPTKALQKEKSGLHLHKRYPTTFNSTSWETSFKYGTGWHGDLRFVWYDLIRWIQNATAAGGEEKLENQPFF